MATYKERAAALARKLNIRLDVEDGSSDSYAVEIWAYDAHMSKDQTHGCVVSMRGWDLNSPAQVWLAVRDELLDFEPCPALCSCRA